MAKLLTSIIALVTVSTALGCQDDGMLIAQHLSPEPMAEVLNPEPSAPDAAEVEKIAVQRMLESNCGACHGRSSTRPPHSLTGAPVRDGEPVIADINDIDALVETGLIIPGWPEASRLVYLMATEAMPPKGSGMPPVGPSELRRLEKFIVRLDPPSRTEVEQILARHCGSCHLDRESPLPINAISDLEVLVAAGFITPGDRDRSPLYTVVLDGDMPPPNAELPLVPNRDLARIGGFIDLMP
jgi:mono/diheme cytochrome c family protein